MKTDERLKECIQEVLLLSIFKSFCEKNDSKDSQQRLRNIYSRTADPVETTKNIIANELQEDISKEDAAKIYLLISAFLKKSYHRKSISDSVKIALLARQKNKCAICGAPVDIHSHADHTVPFKYVGDELEDNYQMLCTNCNLRKNSNIDFQIRYLLKSI